MIHKHMDYYSFTKTGGTKGWVVLLRTYSGLPQKNGNLAKSVHCKLNAAVADPGFLEGRGWLWEPDENWLVTGEFDALWIRM